MLSRCILQHFLLLAICQVVRPHVIAQTPFSASRDKIVQPARSKLHGRFLHITDIHPDTLYRSNASLSSQCHRKQPVEESERSGYWGAPRSECDTSVRLLNLTLDYLEENWANEIDFVIWTGDNARHDEDSEVPRTPEEIYAMNRLVAAKMEAVFTSRGLPVVPSLGNNDIWPHNILEPGPNKITNEYAKIWQTFIPFSSYQVFQRGAYYSTELIPNKVAAISLNTLFFYDSNKAVGGCEYKDKTDAGNLEFDWLDVQLGLFRDRGMQVWLTGHVPPSPGNFYPECFRRYVELSLRFQDTIVGHLYGHMNNDFFFFLDAEDLLQVPNVTETAIKKRYQLHKTLRQDFKEIPSKSKIDLDEWAVVNVSPSVVAYPYLPSFRIYTYNVTSYNAGEELETEKKKKRKGSKRKHRHRHGGKPKDCKKKENRENWECRPQKKWHSDKEAPSRTNTLWSGLGYSQYYMPGVGRGNESERPEWELEYVTYSLSGLHPGRAGEYPIPMGLLPAELRNVTGVDKSRLAPYSMGDLTIGSWVELGRRLVKKKGLWKRFKKYMYME